MVKARNYQAGRTRTVVNSLLGLISYFVLMALMFMPMVAGF